MGTRRLTPTIPAAEWLRVSVGAEDANDAFLQTLESTAAR